MEDTRKAWGSNTFPGIVRNIRMVGSAAAIWGYRPWPLTKATLPAKRIKASSWRLGRQLGKVA